MSSRDVGHDHGENKTGYKVIQNLTIKRVRLNLCPDLTLRDDRSQSRCVYQWD